MKRFNFSSLIRSFFRDARTHDDDDVAKFKARASSLLMKPALRTGAAFYTLSRARQRQSASSGRREVRGRERVCKFALALFLPRSYTHRIQCIHLLYTYLIIVVGAEVYGYEGQPDDAGGVHGEADVLGLVEVLRYLARLERVESAHEDEEHVVDEGHHQGEGRDAAGEHSGKRCWIDLAGIGRLDYQPNYRPHQLYRRYTYTRTDRKTSLPSLCIRIDTSYIYTTCEHDILCRRWRAPRGSRFDVRATEEYKFGASHGTARTCRLPSVSTESQAGERRARRGRSDNRSEARSEGELYHYLSNREHWRRKNKKKKLASASEKRPFIWPRH